MNDKISIVIPVYNVENYVEECIESCVRQTYKNLEIILLNDCSTDQSGEICKHYSEIDSRIIYRDMGVNSGVSATRNEGIKLASGEWIIFVDADDYIDFNLCEKAIEKTKIYSDIDAVNWGYEKFLDCKGQYRSLHATCAKTIPSLFEIMDENDCLEQPHIKDEYMNTLAVSYKDIYRWVNSGETYIKAVHSKKQSCVVWRYMFKLQTLIEFGLNFVEKMRYGEDAIFLFQFLIHCNKISFINEYLYFYRDRETSAMHEVRDIDSKILNIEAKELIITDQTDGDKKFYRTKWEGQVALVVLNSARMHSYRNYIALVHSPNVHSALNKIDLSQIKSVKYKIPFGLLKFGFYRTLFIAMNLASRLGMVNIGLDN